ncbi:MAG: metal-dependent transcriptional regulator [bacterium]
MLILSASLEDYLEVILNLICQKGEAKASDIALKMNVKKASVTDALKALSLKGLIDYEPYKPIILTKQGKIFADNVIERHDILSVFFEKILGLEKAEAADNACRMEHVISANALEKIKDLIRDYTKK